MDASKDSATPRKRKEPKPQKMVFSGVFNDRHEMLKPAAQPEAIIDEQVEALIKAQRLTKEELGQQIIERYKTISKENTFAFRKTHLSLQEKQRLAEIKEGRRYLSFLDGMILCEILKADPWQLLGKTFYDSRPNLDLLNNYYFTEHKIVYRLEEAVYLYKFENVISGKEISVYSDFLLELAQNLTPAFELEATLRINGVSIKNKANLLLLSQDIKSLKLGEEIFRESLLQPVSLLVRQSLKKWVGLFEGVPHCLLIGKSDETLKSTIAPVALHEHLHNLYTKYNYVHRAVEKVKIEAISPVVLEAVRQQNPKTRQSRPKPVAIYRKSVRRQG